MQVTDNVRERESSKQWFFFQELALIIVIHGGIRFGKELIFLIPRVAPAGGPGGHRPLEDFFLVISNIA